MSMKRVLAAFMGVTLLVGNGPVSVFAEEAAAESTAETAIVNLETQGRTNPIGVDGDQPCFFLADAVWRNWGSSEILSDCCPEQRGKRGMGFRCSREQSVK